MSLSLRYLFYTCLLVFLPSGLLAQIYATDYKAGPILKVVSARMKIDSDLVSIPDTESEVGYQFGGFFRVNIDKVFVQSELLFSKVQTQLVFQNYDGIMNFNPRAEFEFNTIELPVNIGYRFGNLRFFMGPSFSILISGERSFLNEVQRVTSEYNRSNLMWHWGIGGDFERVFVDIKYETGLSKTGESLSNLIGRDFVPRQRQWVFSIALNLLRY